MATFTNDTESMAVRIAMDAAATLVTRTVDGVEATIAENVAAGATITDALPPLGVEYAYTFYSGAIESYTHEFPTTQWVLGASPSITLRFNPRATYSLDHGGELYHFAGGGLPVFYGTTEYDESGTLQFDTVGKDKADAIAALLRSQPVQYLRDPFGHRWKAHVRPSVRHGVGSIWNVSLDWRAVRWAE